MSRARCLVAGLVALTGALAVACKRTPPARDAEVAVRADVRAAPFDPDVVVALVAGEPIRAAELVPPGTALGDPARRAAARARYLENAIDRRLYRLEADRLGLPPGDDATRLAALHAAALVPRVTVTDDELRAELRAHPEAYPRAPRVHLRQVFVPLPAEATPATVLAETRRLRDRVARLRDTTPIAALGDDLGLLRHERTPPWGEGVLADPAVREVAVALAPGAVSPVVRGALGLHVLVCVGHEPPGLADLDEARPRLEAVVRARNTARAEAAFARELRARYPVEILDPAAVGAP